MEGVRDRDRKGRTRFVLRKDGVTVSIDNPVVLKAWYSPREVRKSRNGVPARVA